MKKIIIAASFAVAAAGGLQGCVAVPIAAALNGMHKSGTSSYSIAGPEKGFPAAFRGAVQKNGGMVREAGAEYGHAIFEREQVKIEYQKTGSGTYQLAASTANGSARIYDFADSISVKSAAVAQALASAGYKITAAERDRAGL